MTRTRIFNSHAISSAVETTDAVGRLVVVRGLSKKPKQMLLLASQAHAVL